MKIYTYNFQNDLACLFNILRIPMTLEPCEAYAWINNFNGKINRSQEVRENTLTHCNNISTSVVHTRIVLAGPTQANVDPGPQTFMLSAKGLPLGHEQLEGRDGPRENGCCMCRHDLLDNVRDLEIRGWVLGNIRKLYKHSPAKQLGDHSEPPNLQWLDPKS